MKLHSFTKRHCRIFCRATVPPTSYRLGQACRPEGMRYRHHLSISTIFNPTSNLPHRYTLERSTNFQPCCIFHTSTIMKFQSNRFKEKKNGAPESNLTIKIVGICIAACIVGYLEVTRRKLKATIPLSTEDLSRKLQDEFERPGADKLTLSLQIAECELYLARGKEEESMQRVKEIVSKTHNLLEIVKMARELVQNNHQIQALVLYKIIHIPVKSLKEINVTSREILSWITDRITNVGIAIQPLLESDPTTREIAVKYGLRCMEKLLIDLRSVEHLDGDFKALTEACCLHNIAFIYIELNEFETATKISKQGLTCLEKQLGRAATANIYYGALLNDLGLIHERLAKFSDAEQYYIKALESYKSVDANKVPLLQEHVKITKESLAAVRKQLCD